MSSRSRILLIIPLVLLVIAVGVGVGGFVWYWTSGTMPPPVQRLEYPTISTKPVPDDETDPTAPADPTIPSATPLPENPVDFATLQTTNSDIYAWLYVPGTAVDYPVACATDEADGFYLNHNIYREYEFAGTIYSEKKNGIDLMHRNTIFYGHNMLNGTMFSSLHDFEDETFFAEHDTIYIYTPGHIYTYKIFAAYEYDNRHLLNSFDYSDDAVWAEYLAYATDPKTFTVNTRDVPVTTADRIITLSTCVGWNKNVRYLVQGVLINDQPTRT